MRNRVGECNPCLLLLDTLRVHGNGCKSREFRFGEKTLEVKLFHGVVGRVLPKLIGNISVKAGAMLLSPACRSGFLLQ